MAAEKNAATWPEESSDICAGLGEGNEYDQLRKGRRSTEGSGG
jgi:hypothetical protein